MEGVELVRKRNGGEARGGRRCRRRCGEEVRKKVILLTPVFIALEGSDGRHKERKIAMSRVSNPE